MNRFLEYALNYAQIGFYVFPLKPESKVPLTKNGFKDASNNPEQIKIWWEQLPKSRASIAVC